MDRLGEPLSGAKDPLALSKNCERLSRLELVTSISSRSYFRLFLGAQGIQLAKHLLERLDLLLAEDPVLPLWPVSPLKKVVRMGNDQAV